MPLDSIRLLALSSTKQIVAQAGWVLRLDRVRGAAVGLPSEWRAPVLAEAPSQAPCKSPLTAWLALVPVWELALMQALRQAVTLRKAPVVAMSPTVPAVAAVVAVPPLPVLQFQTVCGNATKKSTQSTAHLEWSAGAPTTSRCAAFGNVLAHSDPSVFACLCSPWAGAQPCPSAVHEQSQVRTPSIYTMRAWWLAQHSYIAAGLPVT